MFLCCTEPAQWQQNFSTIKFALSIFYCRGVSHEKQRFGRFSSLPPRPPPLKKWKCFFYCRLAVSEWCTVLGINLLPLSGHNSWIREWCPGQHKTVRGHGGGKLVETLRSTTHWWACSRMRGLDLQEVTTPCSPCRPLWCSREAEEFAVKISRVKSTFRRSRRERECHEPWHGLPCRSSRWFFLVEILAGENILDKCRWDMFKQQERGIKYSETFPVFFVAFFAFFVAFFSVLKIRHLWRREGSNCFEVLILFAV